MGFPKSKRGYQSARLMPLVFFMSYSELLKDPRWQKVKTEIQLRDNFTCQKCGAKNKTVNVHHRHYLTARMPWDYPRHLLILLCVDCHKEEESCNDILKELVPCLHVCGYFNTEIRDAVNKLIDLKSKNYVKG